MKKKVFSKIVIIIIALIINCSILTGSANAQRNASNNRAIPEDDRPSTFMIWLVGSILSTGAVVVGLKNSKRTHQD